MPPFVIPPGTLLLYSTPPKRPFHVPVLLLFPLTPTCRHCSAAMFITMTSQTPLIYLPCTMRCSSLDSTQLLLVSWTCIPSCHSIIPTYTQWPLPYIPLMPLPSSPLLLPVLLLLLWKPLPICLCVLPSQLLWNPYPDTMPLPAVRKPIDEIIPVRYMIGWQWHSCYSLLSILHLMVVVYCAEAYLQGWWVILGVVGVIMADTTTCHLPVIPY